MVGPCFPAYIQNHEPWSATSTPFYQTKWAQNQTIKRQRRTVAQKGLDRASIVRDGMTIHEVLTDAFAGLPASPGPAPRSRCQILAARLPVGGDSSAAGCVSSSGLRGFALLVRSRGESSVHFLAGSGAA